MNTPPDEIKLDDQSPWKIQALASLAERLKVSVWSLRE